MEEIKKTLLKVHRFSDEEVNALIEKTHHKILSKGDFLLKAGQHCRFLAFVQTGSLRFYSKTDANELTLHFFTEYVWLTDYDSLITQQPSDNYLQALERTEVFMITLDDVHLLLEQFPDFRNLLKLLDQSIITAKHLKSISGSTPDERYKLLLQTHPEWVYRFPQMHIASYLGMTKETFSRVKARIK